MRGHSRCVLCLSGNDKEQAGAEQQEQEKRDDHPCPAGFPSEAAAGIPSRRHHPGKSTRPLCRLTYVRLYI
jgi:hypothetical protein